MTNEKAVELLLEKRRELQSFIDATPKPEETYPHMVAFCEALDMAAAAMKEPDPAHWVRTEHGWICSACGCFLDGYYIGVDELADYTRCPKCWAPITRGQ